MACVVLLSQRPAQIKKSLTWIELDDSVLKQTLKKARDDESLRKQMVQSDVAKKTQVAPKDAFLGAQNQQTDRETVSRTKNVAVGGASSMPKLHPRVKDLAKSDAKSKPLSSLGLPILPKVGDLRDTVSDAPQWADQARHAEDYVKGVKDGDRTILNTKEYVFYSFYQRIHQQLDRAWVPILREKLVKMYRNGRQLASEMDHTTRILVTMNKLGEIVRVQVLNESGTRDLDDAAIGAFNQAGPFPNPPKGIMDTKGEIEIPWEFVLRT